MKRQFCNLFAWELLELSKCQPVLSNFKISQKSVLEWNRKKIMVKGQNWIQYFENEKNIEHITTKLAQK